MNLFILSWNAKECAEFMFDKHIVKIILEAVQMLSTAMQVVDPDNPIHCQVKLYRISHRNHPVSVWVRQSLENYLWTLDLVRAMHEEWQYRYDHPPEKKHKSFILAEYLLAYAPAADKFPTQGLSRFAMAMPDTCKRDDPVEAYRAYYRTEEKRALASWKKREAPAWFAAGMGGGAPSAPMVATV